MAPARDSNVRDSERETVRKATNTRLAIRSLYSTPTKSPLVYVPTRDVPNRTIPILDRETYCNFLETLLTLLLASLVIYTPGPRATPEPH